jgi:predicted metal-dependent HD superfamily phosphohydrolase
MLNLKARWAELVEAAHVDWTWRILAAAYSAPSRHYHNLEHVEWCLSLMDKTCSASEAFGYWMRPVEVALFFHDVVYVPGDKRNELLSAQLLESMTPVLRLSGIQIATAVSAIHATRTHEAVFVDNVVTAAVVGIDLSILGSLPEEYDRYVANVRKEYGHVSGEAWSVGRRGFLRDMIARPGPIFLGSIYRQLFEEQAQANMRRELADLERAVR